MHVLPGLDLGRVELDPSIFQLRALFHFHHGVRATGQWGARVHPPDSPRLELLVHKISGVQLANNRKHLLSGTVVLAAQRIPVHGNAVEGREVSVGETLSHPARERVSGRAHSQGGANRACCVVL